MPEALLNVYHIRERGFNVDVVERQVVQQHVSTSFCGQLGVPQSLLSFIMMLHILSCKMSLGIVLFLNLAC